MASSVSSERAFSSAGITISKRRNRLKGDIVEALHSLKCAIREDLLFRELPGSGAGTDLEDEDLIDDPEWTGVSSVTDKSESLTAGDLSEDEDAWDNLVDGLDDELDVLDDDDDDVYVQNIM